MQAGVTGVEDAGWSVARSEDQPSCHVAQLVGVAAVVDPIGHQDRVGGTGHPVDANARDGRVPQVVGQLIDWTGCDPTVAVVRAGD